MKKRFFCLLLCCLLAAGLALTALAAGEIADGVYTAEAALTGGSGRASVESPLQITAAGGVLTARVVWSSPNYTYMEIGGERYLPLKDEKTSVFEVPVVLDEDMPVLAETVAMSQPYVIEYVLRVDGSTLRSAKSAAPSEPAMAVVAGAIAAAVVILFLFVYRTVRKGKES